MYLKMDIIYISHISSELDTCVNCLLNIENLQKRNMAHKFFYLSMKAIIF